MTTVASSSSRIALVGNPNTGKTTLFNLLTGLTQKVGNYPGVTVERKSGTLRLDGQSVEVIDLPGTYSMAARSLDEQIVNDVLLGKAEAEAPIDLLVAIVDASNLQRNLYLVSQLLELKRPMLVVLNMSDIADGMGLTIDARALENQIHVPVVSISAGKRKGLDRFRSALTDALQRTDWSFLNTPVLPESVRLAVGTLKTWFQEQGEVVPTDVELQRLLIDENGYREKQLHERHGAKFSTMLEQARQSVGSSLPLSAVETRARYDWLAEILQSVLVRPQTPVPSMTNSIDSVLTHRVWGSLIFLVIMVVVFQSIYSWAGPLMDIIDSSIGAVGVLAASVLPAGALQSLVVDGIIAGVGAVVIFVPQIAILFLFLALLEDCGYLPRAAYLMDRLLSFCGLSGKAFIPMMSSFACAIPAVMATRTIEDRPTRYVTILVAPLMSCSARLPVYLIFIAAFVPGTTLLGDWINVQGLVLMGMYLVGIVVAIPVAWVAQMWFAKREPSSFVLELPTYKMPSVRSVAIYVYERVMAFLYRAGTIIFCATVVIWALTYFPRSEETMAPFEAQRETLQQQYASAWLDEALAAQPNVFDAGMAAEEFVATVEETVSLPEEPAEEDLAVLEPYERAFLDYQGAISQIDAAESGELVRSSYMGMMGRTIEPLVEPLGWDWRIGMATLASFPAREVIIATLGTIFNLGNETDEESVELREIMRDARREDGTPLFTLAVALSIMVFFALCSQCVSTLAVIKRETNSWSWPVFSFVYMTVLAYVGAFVTYHLASFVGWG